MATEQSKKLKTIGQTANRDFIFALFSYSMEWLGYMTSCELHLRPTAETAAILNMEDDYEAVEEAVLVTCSEEPEENTLTFFRVAGHDLKDEKPWAKSRIIRTNKYIEQFKDLIADNVEMFYTFSSDEKAAAHTCAVNVIKHLLFYVYHKFDFDKISLNDEGDLEIAECINRYCTRNRIEIKDLVAEITTLVEQFPLEYYISFDEKMENEFFDYVGALSNSFIPYSEYITLNEAESVIQGTVKPAELLESLKQRFGEDKDGK